jgi:hypothetical protein
VVETGRTGKQPALAAISARCSTAALTASDFQALGSRLSIAAIAALPPTFQIHSFTTLWIVPGYLPWKVYAAMPSAFAVSASAANSSQFFGTFQPLESNRDWLYQWP